MRSVRKYWTAEQVANTFASHQEVFETTLEWLHDLGIDSERIKHSAGELWISKRVSIRHQIVQNSTGWSFLPL